MLITNLRSLLLHHLKMDSAECNSCDVRNSIYGRMCNDNQNYGLINGCINEEVQPKGLQVLKHPKRRKKVILLSTLDILISLFVVTPLVVACWRGTWQLMDIYQEYFSPWNSFLIGVGVHIVIAVTQESFHKTFLRKRKHWGLNVLSFLLMKLYTMLFNIVTNMHWRGGWMIVDNYFGITVAPPDVTDVDKKTWAFLFFAVCFLILFLMKCLRNLNSPPFEISLDYGDEMFLFPSMFKIKVSDKMSLYILDMFLSVTVVTNLVVFVWRGLWLIVDLYFFPDDYILSSWASTFLGYVIVAIVFLVQPTVKKLCDQLTGIPKLLVADSYIMFSVIGVILVWRGIWNLINIYFLPDYEELSCWLSHWISLVILIFMGCSNSVLVRGVCLDAEEPDGTCVVFPCHYLRIIFLEEKCDTWFSIWSGNVKNPEKSRNNIDVLNYHVIKISDVQDKGSKNNNNNNIL